MILSFRNILVRRCLASMLLMLFFSMNLFSQSLNSTVYICTNQGKKYHIDKDCRFLGQCRYNPKSVTLKEAIDGQQTNDGKISFTYCKGCSKSIALVEKKYRSGDFSSLESKSISLKSDKKTRPKKREISNQNSIKYFNR